MEACTFDIYLNDYIILLHLRERERERERKREREFLPKVVLLLYHEVLFQYTLSSKKNLPY